MSENESGRSNNHVQEDKQWDWLLWVAGAAALLVCVGHSVLFLMQRQQVGKVGNDFPFTLMLTNTMVLVLLPVFVYIALTRRDPAEPWRVGVAVNLLSLLIGLLAGWALAVFWVPYDSIDGKLYGQIGATVALVSSGYLFAKFDKLLSHALGGDKAIPPQHVVTTVLLGLAAMVFTALLVITNRVEYLQAEAAKNPERAVLKARAEHEFAKAVLANAEAAASSSRGTRRAAALASAASSATTPP